MILRHLWQSSLWRSTIVALLWLAVVPQGVRAQVQSSSADFNPVHSRFTQKQQNKCVPIEVKQCHGIGYNETRFPNFAGDETAQSAAEVIAGFDPLIGTRCSEELRFFLCSVYYPMCTEKVPKAIGPCRPLCLRVHKACAPLLKEFNYDWPAVLECAKFPVENGPAHMCMAGPATSGVQESQEMSGSSVGGGVGVGGSAVYVSAVGGSPGGDGSVKEWQKPLDSSGYQYATDTAVSALPDGRCPLSDWVYVNRTAQCVPLCHTNLDFSPSEIYTARSTLLVGSVVSVCLTTICLVASCVRGHPLRTQQPIDRSLFFCTFCFAVSAALYVLSSLFKDSIACSEYNDQLLYAVKGLPNIRCTCMAVLLYYFGTAGRLWWLMLCLAWRWSMKEHSLHEMEKFTFRALIIAFALPLFLVTMALMAQSVHPEYVSGVCLVGTGSQPQHQIFIALREFLIMMVAVLSLASGFLNTMHNRTAAPRRSPFPSAGFIGVLYPLAAGFLLISSLQSHFNPLLGRWTPLAAFQLLADPSLGMLVGAAHFIFLLCACYQHGPLAPGLLDKGYLPAATAPAPPTSSCLTTTPTATMYQQVASMPASTWFNSIPVTAPTSGASASPPAVPQVPIPPVPSI